MDQRDIQPAGSMEESKDQYATYATDKEVDHTKVDAVWGVQGENDVHYPVMGWKKTCIILLKTQIALGVLGMPTALLAVGGFPGALIIFLMCALGGYTAYIYGQFKIRHPEVYSVADAGYILAGRFGREFCDAGYILFQVCLTGTALVPIAIALETLSDHAVCNVVWYVIALGITFGFASVQTLGKVSWLTTVGFVSIMASIITLSIAVGVQDRPAAAPQTGPWDKGISAIKPDVTFLQGVGALATAIFGVCGHAMYFSTISEMARPREFTKSMSICYSIMTATYLTIGIVVYVYAGQYLSSPALGSAGVLMSKVAYGIAFPGLCASALLYCHFGAKALFVRLLRGTPDLTSHSKKHWIVWIGSVAAVSLGGFILAEAVPFFSALSIIIAAFFGCFYMATLPAACWYRDNWKQKDTNPTVFFYALCALNACIFAFGIFMQIAGTYTGVRAIIDFYAADNGVRPFGC